MNISPGYTGLNQSLYAQLGRGLYAPGRTASPLREEEPDPKKDPIRALSDPTLSPQETKERDEKLVKMGLKEKEYDHHDPTCECETCKRRKYMDGSNEMVSFKSAQHMSPTEAATRVRAHEQEHVANAYDKAKKDNGKVLMAAVQIYTRVCPECGRTYVSGGTTTTQIKYYNEENPYQKDLKAQHHDQLAGANVNYAV